MFAARAAEEVPIEVIEEEEKAARVPMELAANECREQAFKVQEWTTAAFGKFEAPANEYRVTRKGEHYYVETLSKQKGSTSAYGYVGLMVHERDLFALVTVLVRAVREKQREDAPNG